MKFSSLYPGHASFHRDKLSLTSGTSVANLLNVKRRRFMQAIAAAPAVPALVTPALVTQQNMQAQTAPARPAGPLASGKRDAVGEPVARFFSATQLAALHRLCELLMPPMGGNPGAIEAGVPEFLDFHVGQSPADRQQMYRSGLELLNSRSAAKFGKAFAALDATQADAIIRPLLVLVPWQFELPKEPGARFMAAAHDDIRVATRNSREWTQAAIAAGRRPVGAQLYFFPVDPVYKG
ncbi:MAG: gluconate 2-dehydrogenase subunit 3 family protein [Acidobacteriia bacterium]|jgi:hypothetical protein|nr:gluconate 2-dehydrogenase subunit 3 family protein [Terriglobia bacterium]